MLTVKHKYACDYSIRVTAVNHYTESMRYVLGAINHDTESILVLSTLQDWYIREYISLY